MEFKVGNRVKITNSPAPNDKDVGKISTIVSTYKNDQDKTVYTLDNPNRILYCPNWSAEYLEKVPFEVGDYVKYKNGTSAYEVIEIKSKGYLRLRHSNSSKIYDEPDLYKLIKLQFKIGDIVEVCNPVKFRGIIRTIEEIDCRKESVFYKISNINEKIAEKNLKLTPPIKQPEKILAFHKGELVYIDPNKVESKENCYKLWEVIKESADHNAVECSGNGMSSVWLVKDRLTKPIFKECQHITIETDSWIIEDVYFSMTNTLCYTIHNSRIGSRSYTEDELLQKVAEDAVLNYDLEDNSVITSKNLNKNDKNRLQEEGTPEQSGSDARRSTIHGRKSRVTIKVGHLDNKKVIGRSQG